MLKRIVAAVSRILPAALWERLEYASAYFAGKGSGSSSLAAEVSAASRFMGGDDIVIFDIGANEGDWTEEAIQRMGPRVKAVWQCEPSPKNIDILAKRFSEDSRVSLLPCAVSDKSGEADLFSDTPGSGMASLHDRKLDHFNIAFKKEARVTVVTIDDIVAKQKIVRIDFMKMDIEGHEFAALKGAARTLRNGVVKALSFEFGGANIDSRTYFQDFWYFLTPLGFSIWRILPSGGVLPIKKYSEMLEGFRTTNYIAVRGK